MDEHCRPLPIDQSKTREILSKPPANAIERFEAIAECHTSRGFGKIGWARLKRGRETVPLTQAYEKGIRKSKRNRKGKSFAIQLGDESSDAEEDEDDEVGGEAYHGLQTLLENRNKEAYEQARLVCKKAVEMPNELRRSRDYISVLPDHFTLEGYRRERGESFDLKPHQREGAGRLRRLLADEKGAILADEMGSGKTLTSTLAIADLYKEMMTSGRGFCLIVTKLSIIGNWKEHLSKCLTPTPDIRIYSGLTQDDKKNLSGNLHKHHFVITTFQMLMQEWRTYETLRDDFKDAQKGYTQKVYKSGKNRMRKTIPRPFEVYPLVVEPTKLLLVDECHRMSNPRSLTSRCLRGLDADARLFISGTLF